MTENIHKSNKRPLVKNNSFDEALSQDEKRISARLLHLRHCLNISIEQLAYALEIEEEELIRYENGKEAIPASIIVLAAIALGVKPNYFYGQATNMDIPSIQDSYKINQNNILSC